MAVAIVGVTLIAVLVTATQRTARRDVAAAQELPGAQRAPALRNVGLDDQHVAGSLVRYGVRDAAQDALGAVHALVSNDDQLRVDRAGDV
jgi:hypothetical protein